MNRDNKLVKFTTFVLLITIVAVALVSGTYAKYTTKTTGTATATVAKFSVDDNFSDTEKNEKFDLFATVNEADGTTTEEDVLAGKIAPGTGGSFKVTLTNNSEVTVDATLTLEETANANSIPVEYSLNGTTYVTAANFTETVRLAKTNGTDDITVYWRWAFEGSASTNFTVTQTDTTDTTLGETATETAPTLTVEATATFVQVD